MNLVNVSYVLQTSKGILLSALGHPDSIHRADIRLSDISNLLGADWVPLASELGISTSDVNLIKTEYPDSVNQQAMVMLRLWLQTSGNKATGKTLCLSLSLIRVSMLLIIK
jgi:ankyrin